jgi:hypothetical protein
MLCFTFCLGIVSFIESIYLRSQSNGLITFCCALSLCFEIAKLPVLLVSLV